MALENEAVAVLWLRLWWKNIKCLFSYKQSNILKNDFFAKSFVSSFFLTCYIIFDVFHE